MSERTAATAARVMTTGTLICCSTHPSVMRPQIMVEGARVEAYRGMQGLILGLGSDVFMHGQVRQERFDLRFGREEVVARPHAMEMDEADDPLTEGAFGVHRGVVQTEHPSDFMEACGLLTSGRVRHIKVSVMAT